MNHVIRRAHPDDAPALYDAWEALRRHYATADERVIYDPVSREEFVAAVGPTLLRPDSVTFIALDGERVSGFVTGAIEVNLPDRLPERYARVGQLYVEPGSRHEKLGRRLVAEFAAWAARHEGISHMEMSVLAEDSGAAPFWRSLGFQTYIERVWAPVPLDTPA